MVEPPAPAVDGQRKLAASTRVLRLPPGFYRFSVVPGSATGIDRSEHLVLPAVYLAVGPDSPSKAINLVPGPSANGTWLCGPDDLVFAGVADGDAKLLMTSIPSGAGEVLEIAIDRVDG